MLWEKNGLLIEDSAGQLCDDEECPCDTTPYPVRCCDFSAVPTATATLVVNGVTIVVSLTNIGSGILRGTYDCGESSRVEVTFECYTDPGVSPSGFLILVTFVQGVFPFSILIFRYDAIALPSGTFVGTCSPFFFRWIGHDTSGGADGETFCGITFGSSRTNTIDISFVTP